MLQKIQTWLTLKKAFGQWRNPIRGKVSAEEQTNPFWVYAVKTKKSAYALNMRFLGKDSFTKGPCWCFDRTGQAEITLKSGIKYSFGGEHEDYYDPDFYIYNDVVISENDDVRIHGYTVEEFPPTDFHTTTLVDNSIFLIGNLGYPEDRKVGTTQVLCFNLKSLSFSNVKTSGIGPGWISSHSSHFVEERNTIEVRGGRVFGNDTVDNLEQFELNLENMEWKKTSNNNFYQCIIERSDGDSIELFEKRMAARFSSIGISSMVDWKCTEQQSELLNRLYASPAKEPPTENDDDDDTHNEFRQVVDGVKIVFKEESHGVVVRVEGKRDTEIDKFLSNSKALIEEIEGADCTITEISPSYSNLNEQAEPDNGGNG